MGMFEVGPELFVMVMSEVFSFLYQLYASMELMRAQHCVMKTCLITLYLFSLQAQQ